ncbi:MAG: LytR C-terminal domain-containing protein [bacterium]|nr:LytR C-terminal domain-containing protein [bacterium]
MLKIIIGVLIVAIIAVGGFMYYQSVQDKLANPPADTEVALSDTEEKPTPTPEKSMKPGDYSIEVQNGSGIAGQAGIVEELLADNDYEVKSTGNADNYDYEETVIQAKADVSKDWLDEIKKVLKEKYDVQSKVEELDEDAETDVVVVVGSLDADGEALGESTSITEESSDTTAESNASGTETPTPSPTKSA